MSNMGFELGSGTITMVDLETGIKYDFGECASLEVEQWSQDAEPSTTIKGLINPAELSCEVPMSVDKDSFNELFGPFNSSEFTCEWDTPILIQARWHKKARIRKKWLKRYGHKEDVVKTIAKAKQGEYNTETGECEIDVDSIQFNFKPYQMCRECMMR